MKNLMFFILFLIFPGIFCLAQRKTARKQHRHTITVKKRRVKKTVGAKSPEIITIERTAPIKFDIHSVTKPATETAPTTIEGRLNQNYYHPAQPAASTSPVTQEYFERFISPSETQITTSALAGVPLIYIAKNEDIPTGRILNGPSQYDSRIDIRALDPTLDWVKKIVKNGYSVAVVVNRSRLRQVSKDFYQIDDSYTLGNTYQLCPGEAFRNQPVVGTGTAIVTGKRQMLTAGHVFAGPVNQYAIIFGYEITNKAGTYQTTYPADSVYFPVSIVSQSADLDIAIFAVDRDIRAAPLKWSNEINPPVNEAIYMIGFPYGLPKKVAANAEVIMPNNDLTSFYTSLDAFQGNSGSPVFNLKTNEVIGILVSGNIDYHWNGSCNISVDCSAPYCQGEKAVRITVIKSLLNIAD